MYTISYEWSTDDMVGLWACRRQPFSSGSSRMVVTFVTCRSGQLAAGAQGLVVGIVPCCRARLDAENQRSGQHFKRESLETKH